MSKQSIIVSFSARASWGLTLQRYCKNKGVSRSRFIRDAVNAALLKDGATGALVEHLAVPNEAWADDEGSPRCNPHYVEGTCMICWPNGVVQ